MARGFRDCGKAAAATHAAKHHAGDFSPGQAPA